MAFATVQGQRFEIDDKFKAGDVIDGNTAAALNRLRVENICNNFRNRVTELLGEKRCEAKEKLTKQEH